MILHRGAMDFPLQTPLSTGGFDADWGKPSF